MFLCPANKVFDIRSIDRFWSIIWSPNLLSDFRGRFSASIRYSRFETSKSVCIYFPGGYWLMLDLRYVYCLLSEVCIVDQGAQHEHSRVNLSLKQSHSQKKTNCMMVYLWHNTLASILAQVTVLVICWLSYSSQFGLFLCWPCDCSCINFLLYWNA